MVIKWLFANKTINKLKPQIKQNQHLNGRQLKINSKLKHQNNLRTNQKRPNNHTTNSLLE